MIASAKITPNFRARIRNYDWVLFCIIAVAAIMFFWNLGAHPLKNWDESIYAEISKEMLRSGNWLTLNWGSQPWFEKPPLYMWVTTLFFKLFGVNEFSARLPSAISGIGLVTTTYLLARHMYGKAAAVLAGIMVLTGFQIVQASRLVILDVMMTFFIFLAIYFYVRAADGNSKWWYLVATAAALAIMTKGFGALSVVVAMGLAVLLDGRLMTTVKQKHFWLACVLAIVLIAPWHIAMYWFHGQAFADEYVGYHVLTRTFTSIEGHQHDYLRYFGEFIEKFKPWWVLVPFALTLNAVDNSKSKRSRSWILLLITILVFGIHTLARTQLSWYITPVYPAMSILVGALLVRVYRYANWLKPVVLAFFIFGCLFAISKLGQPYQTTDPVDTPIKTLAVLARRADVNDHAPLIVFDGERHAAMFYSDRVIQQATTRPGFPNPKLSTRYENFMQLADVTDGAPKRILFESGSLAKLSSDYEIDVVAESDPWVYAWIKKRNGKITQQNAAGIR